MSMRAKSTRVNGHPLPHRRLLRSKNLGGGVGPYGSGSNYGYGRFGNRSKRGEKTSCTHLEKIRAPEARRCASLALVMVTVSRKVQHRMAPLVDDVRTWSPCRHAVREVS